MTTLGFLWWCWRNGLNPLRTWWAVRQLARGIAREKELETQLWLRGLHANLCPRCKGYAVDKSAPCPRCMYRFPTSTGPKVTE